MATLVVFPLLEDVAGPLLLVIPLAGVFVAGVVASDSSRRHVHRAILIAALQAGLTMAVCLDSAACRLLVLCRRAAVAGRLSLADPVLDPLPHEVRSRGASYHARSDLRRCLYVRDAGDSPSARFTIWSTYPGPEQFPGKHRAAAWRRQPRSDVLQLCHSGWLTLGYGDITPRSHVARSLAVVEALVGMLYIAVFMARLVSPAVRPTRANEKTERPDAFGLSFLLSGSGCYVRLFGLLHSPACRGKVGQGMVAKRQRSCRQRDREGLTS